MTAELDDGTVKLWQAVLQKAVADYTRGPTQDEIADYIFGAKIDAETWMFSDSTEPYSFVWVCEALGLEPSAVRREAKARKQD